MYMELAKRSTSILWCCPGLAVDRDLVDDNVLQWLVRGTRRDLGDLDYHIKALYHLAEDRVLAVKMRGWSHGNEELRPVGVGAGIGHGQ